MIHFKNLRCFKLLVFDASVIVFMMRWALSRISSVIIPTVILFLFLSVSNTRYIHAIGRVEQQMYSFRWVDSVVALHTYDLKLTEPAEALPFLRSAFSNYIKNGEMCKATRAGSLLSHCYEYTGQLDSAIITSQKALGFFSGRCDSLLLMSVIVNYTNALLALGETDKVLKLTNDHIAMWNPHWPYSIALNGLLTNKAIAIFYSGKTKEALEAFRACLRNALKEKNENNILDAYSNMGAIYGMIFNKTKSNKAKDSVLYYNNLCLLECRKAGNLESQIVLFSNIAAFYTEAGNYKWANSYLDSSYALSYKYKNLEGMVTCMLGKANNFEKIPQLDSSLRYLRQYIYLKDSMMDKDKQKSIVELQEKYQAEKRAKEIVLLGKENQLKNSEIRKQKLMRNSLIVGFSAVLIFSIVFYRQRNKIAAERRRSDELLLNILPMEVAEELKQKGEAKAVHLDLVTVLFADFKGFTFLSEQLSPVDLLKDLNECFSAFDNITTKYGIEKIKTIGDAYMAAGGLPTINTTHAWDILNAALEMRDFVEKYNIRKQSEGKPCFEIRIGIHTGPVVAGIVGVKKFQYDIWGDTVNTASRMESNGLPGKVNISETTYQILHSTSQFSFLPRGKVSVKGKGEMEMYFADYAT